MFNDNSGISAFQERTREALAEEEDDELLETLSKTVSPTHYNVGVQTECSPVTTVDSSTFVECLQPEMLSVNFHAIFV